MNNKNIPLQIKRINTLAERLTLREKTQIRLSYQYVFFSLRFMIRFIKFISYLLCIVFFIILGVTSTGILGKIFFFLPNIVKDYLSIILIIILSISGLILFFGNIQSITKHIFAHKKLYISIFLISFLYVVFTSYILLFNNSIQELTYIAESLSQGIMFPIGIIGILLSILISHTINTEYGFEKMVHSLLETNITAKSTYGSFQELMLFPKIIAQENQNILLSLQQNNVEGIIETATKILNLTEIIPQYHHRIQKIFLGKYIEQLGIFLQKELTLLNDIIFLNIQNNISLHENALQSIAHTQKTSSEQFSSILELQKSRIQKQKDVFEALLNQKGAKINE